jgi:mannose-1-phosphate guanylyltransferase/mannose-6-phosphate isomerase
MSEQTPIYPVILSGCAGTRLWPLSRASFPKQFLPLVDDRYSLLQQTLLRSSKLPGSQAPILVCNAEHRFLVGEQCRAINQQPAAIYVEPIGRNTATAIALAALHLAEHPTHPNPDAVMLVLLVLLVLPADHVIQQEAAFAQTVACAVRAAEQGWLVTFGITPTAAEIGFGYIRAEETGNGKLPEGALPVARFVEKPDAYAAQRYLDEGGYYWNSGMFVFTARRYLEELARLSPEIEKKVRKAWQERSIGTFVCPDGEPFINCPADSIDYAVMQGTKHAVVVPAEIGWSDVGSCDALWAVLPKDERSNTVRGDAMVFAGSNNLVHAGRRHVMVVGLNNTVVVEMPDVVLVVPKNLAQQVKHTIEHLDRAGRREHLENIRVHRPWGWFEKTDCGERFQVKRLMVKPGHQLSLQMHHHRAEHWVVVSGTTKVRVGNQEQLLSENESIYIPIGQAHRLSNPGRLELHIVEVQSGGYLAEDDIIRFEDQYARISADR